MTHLHFKAELVCRSKMNSDSVNWHRISYRNHRAITQRMEQRRCCDLLKYASGLDPDVYRDHLFQNRLAPAPFNSTAVIPMKIRISAERISDVVCLKKYAFARDPMTVGMNCSLS
jgi:hypothetical protein